MTSRSKLTYAERAAQHPHPVAKLFLETAERKQSNVVVSADLTTSHELLDCAALLGPYIAVFKTHIDIVQDFSQATVDGLKDLAAKHDFLIFEDRKFVDIGNTVQKQYHGGALKISEFAHIVNASILGGDGIVDALAQVMENPDFPNHGERALILLAEMTSKGSLATGSYTAKCIELARQNNSSVVGFVATRSLESVSTESVPLEDEDFLVFTTGVNQTNKGDKLGQQYQTPTSAVEGGADFIIAGRGIYAASDPVDAVQSYQKEGWNAYLKRLEKE